MILVFCLITWLILTTDVCLFWHTCSMLLYPIYFWCVWTDLLYFLSYLLIPVHVSIFQTISSSLAVGLLPSRLNIQVQTTSTSFYINKKNENTCWKDAIAKEMENVKVTIENNGHEYCLYPWKAREKIPLEMASACDLSNSRK